MRKIFLISLVVLGLTASGFGGYYVWRYYSESATNNDKSGTGESGGVTPPATTASSTETSGKFKLVTNTSLITSYEKEWAAPPLQNNWVSADWSPDFSGVVYLENLGEKTSLGLFTPSNLKKQVLASLMLQDVKTTWLNSNEIIIADKPSKSARGSIWKYKIKEKVFEVIAQDELGLWVEWNKTLGLGVKWSASQNKTSVVKNDGKLLKTLPFVTMPNKCAFEGDSIFCAVPSGIPSGAHLPDDYLKGALSTRDMFYSVSLKTGDVKLITEAEGQIDATQVSKNGNKLLFINRYDNKIYELSL